MNKKNKDISVANKIYEIAELVGDLNSDRKLKCGVQNNFGHATILKVATGCNIRVHHMFDNCLSLDLLISQSAQDRYQEKCRSAKSKFNQLFPGKAKEDDEFIIPSRAQEPHYRLWIDITNFNIDEITEVIGNIKINFA